MSQSPQRVKTKLSDYKPSGWLIPEVDLEFSLHPTNTIVKSKFRIIANPASKDSQNSSQNSPRLFLNGESLSLVSIRLDGRALSKEDFILNDHGLEILNLNSDEHEIEIENTIKPLENTELLGLYQSNGIYCSQNEPEGFRRITYFIDRPDILSIYSVKIIVDPTNCPIALSNGNRIGVEDLADGRKVHIWKDPFPKPSYLFALVAGDLDKINDQFITMSGRKVDLEIYSNKGLSSYCNFAMESLKLAMKWDEERFGREYDLDLYMIVAVNDFNMGAMENKGLNIFNSKLVLASEQTATDSVFEDILSVIAHEYFHNWTGNRITCRNWFQLTLKEGLTVFRDQLFSQDKLGSGVKRIDDVDFLRNYQFPEDNGPLSHPIQPKEYLDIDNFYTRTVYEKGAEVIRMIYTLLGEENFRKGMNLYFERHDGQAVTTKEFIDSMQDSTSIDLKTFRNWYDRKGTPILSFEEKYNEVNQNFEILWKDSNFSNSKIPLTYPIKYSVYQDEEVVDEGIWQLNGDSGIIHVGSFSSKPTLSLLETFSAPIELKWQQSIDEEYFLWAKSKDAFVRWDSGNKIKNRIIQTTIDSNFVPDPKFEMSYATILESIPKNKKDFRLLANLINIPNLTNSTNLQKVYKLPETKYAISLLRESIATIHSEALVKNYQYLNSYLKEESNRLKAVGARMLKNTSLSFLKDESMVFDQWLYADNLTDEIASLRILSHSDSEYFSKIMDAFFSKWKTNPLVLDFWFSCQA
ncbi:MAG: aminopeptidase N, partial [Leptospira sp.]|nr:aminopeptidase N [Leptospira sp.]